MRRRGGVSRGLAALAVLLALATTLAWYARVAILDSEGFADRAAASVRDRSVRNLLAARLTDQVVLGRRPDLVTARPLIGSALGGIVGGAAFGSLLRRAVLDVHRAVFAREASTVTLTVADAGTLAAAAVRKLKPELAAELGDSGRITLLSRRIGTAAAAAARRADRIRGLAWALAALTLAAAAAALALAPDRRRTAAGLGVSAIVAGVAIVVGVALGRALVVNRVGGAEERAAAAAVWDAYLGGLRTSGWLLAATGAVVAAAASSVLRPVALERPLAAVWRAAATEPGRPALRLLRALALIAAGVLVVLETAVALHAAATVAGARLLYAGVTALLRVISRPGGPAAARRRWLAVPILAVAAVAAADAVFVVTGAASPPPARAAAL